MDSRAVASNPAIRSQLLLRLNIYGRIERPGQKSIIERLVPAPRLWAEIGAATIPLSGFIDVDRALWGPHDPGQSTF